MSDELVSAGDKALQKLRDGLQRGGLRQMAARRNQRSLLLVDCSYSMSTLVRGGLDGDGKRKIDALREVVRDLKRTIDVPIAAFGTGMFESVQLVASAEAIPEPSGDTPMHSGITFAMDLGANHIVLVSDGEPDDPYATREAARVFAHKIDCYYIGNPNDHGAKFMRELAALTGGTCKVTDLGALKELQQGIRGFLTGQVGG